MSFFTRFSSLFFTRFFLVVSLFLCGVNNSKSISYTNYITANIEIQTATALPILPLPIEPIKQKKWLKKWQKKEHRATKAKPIWDIWYIYIIGGGALFLPISLLLFGLGLGWSLVWLWALGLGFGLILVAFLLLLHFSLRQNQSIADVFFERGTIIALIAVVALFGLTAFFTALALPLLWLWVVGLGVFVLASIMILVLILRLKKL
jgi:hypothetical protein